MNRWIALLLCILATPLLLLWTICWFVCVWLPAPLLICLFFLCGNFTASSTDLIPFVGAMSALVAAHYSLKEQGGTRLQMGRAICIFAVFFFPFLSDDNLLRGLVTLAGLAASNLWLNTSRRSLLAAQAKLVEQESGGRACIATTVAGLGTVQLEDKAAPGGQKTVVLINGFGAGNGNYRSTLGLLCDAGLRVFAVEWLGWGLSDRKPFNCTSPAKVLDYMVPALERWREAQGIEVIDTLCCHSMGSIIGAEYALRYPSRVKHLILASPCGLPTAAASSTKSIQQLITENGLRIGLMSSDFFWKKILSPISILRWLGPVAAPAVQFLIRKRFSWMAKDSKAHGIDPNLLADYLQNLWLQPRCAEKALNVLLKARAQNAGESISDKFTQGGAALHPACKQWELSFIYGNHTDWMG